MGVIYKGLFPQHSVHKYLEIQGKIYAPISTTGIILPCGSGLGYGGVVQLGVVHMTFSMPRSEPR